MKILHLTNAGGFGRVQRGGAERAVGELSSALADRHGWDEYVYGPAEFLDRQQFSAAVTRLPGSLESFGVRSALSRSGPLQKTIRDVDPDIVVGHLLRGTIAGSVAARSASQGRFVSILHNSLHDMQSEGRGARDRANVAAFHFVGRRYVDLHVAISDSNLRDLVERDGIDRSKVVRIHNWVSGEFAPSAGLAARAQVRNQLGLRDDDFVLAIVGRLEAQKNHELAIEAVANTDGAHLVIVGEGSLEVSLKEQAKALGAEDRVHFVGQQSSVAPYFEAADLTLVPSHFEGFGRTVIESLAVGTPMIASDLPAIREILDGVPESAFSVANPSDLKSWTELIKARRAAPRPTAETRAELAADIGTRFSLDAAATAYDAAFRELLTGADR